MATATNGAQERLAGATQVGRYFVRAVGSLGGYDVLDVNGYAIAWRAKAVGAYARAEELTVCDARAGSGTGGSQRAVGRVALVDAWRRMVNDDEH